MNTDLNTTEIATVLAAIEENNRLTQQMLGLLGRTVELPVKTTTAAQFLADLTAPVAEVTPHGTILVPVTNADVTPEPGDVLTSDPAEISPNKVLAAWLRANAFQPSGEAWAVGKALVREGMTPEQALTVMVGGTPVTPDLTKIPVVVKGASTPKAVKTPKAKAPKKVHPPIACGDCGTIVQEPKWNQRYCPEHSAERKDVFQAMLNQHRAAAKS